MKKILVCLSLAIALAGCKKDNNGSNSNSAIKAAFGTTHSGYYLNQKIAFNNNSSNAKTYAWDFGDGESSTVQSPTHAYNTPGTYTVVLTVNGSSTFSKSIMIFNGTASYQVSNVSDFDLDLVSFAADNSNNIIDFVDHGVINSGGISDTVFTSDAQIYVGGTLPNDSTFIAVPAHNIKLYTNNILLLADSSQIVVGNLRKQNINRVLHLKPTAVRTNLVQKIRRLNKLLNNLL